MSAPTLFIIINGKKAGNPELREAIYTARTAGFTLEVRSTWEEGDVRRFLKEAVAMQSPRVAIAGGDGSVNEIVEALLQYPQALRPELAILPMGTANDFATACTIPSLSASALELALQGTPEPIDAVRVNDKALINIASIGFGAEVTVDTPVELKNFLGGGAYTLMGILKAMKFQPYRGKATIGGKEYHGELIVGAVCNGRLAGGGQQLAPKAFINDGLLDIVFLKHFPMTAMEQVIAEIRGTADTEEYIARFQTTTLITESFEEPIPVNLDGEPLTAQKISYTLVPKSINLVLPKSCPCIL